MDIQLQGRKLKHERTLSKWREWYRQHTEEKKTITEIAKSHINPQTGKNYRRETIYLAFKYLREINEN